jgi:hypothetical protein
MESLPNGWIMVDPAGMGGMGGIVSVSVNPGSQALLLIDLLAFSVPCTCPLPASLHHFPLSSHTAPPSPPLAPFTSSLPPVSPLLPASSSLSPQFLLSLPPILFAKQRFIPSLVLKATSLIVQVQYPCTPRVAPLKADIDGLNMLEADDGSSIDSKADSPSGPLLARTSSSLKAEDLNEPSIKVG